MTRFVLLGAGFWARYQLAAWQELPDVRCVAVCDPAREKAETLAREGSIPCVYTDAAEALEREQPDFVDIVTPPPTHAALVRLAAERGIPVICQKPMATSVGEAEAMTADCARAGVPFLVHENYRWQRPFRELKRELDSGVIGRPYRARIEAITGFPAFANQPGLRELEQFILTDMGSHTLDMARVLFGEARDLYCRTQRIHPDIRGEDVATVLLTMGRAPDEAVTVVCHLGLAETPLEIDRPVETFFFIEGEYGSLELGPDYWVRRTTAEGTFARRYPPTPYPWALTDYLLSQSSMVDCVRDLLSGVRGGPTETNGADNLKTVRLIYAAYQSAAERQVITLEDTEPR
jgi:D-apiose dehydrogenase